MKNLILAAFALLCTLPAVCGSYTNSIKAFYMAVDAGDFDKAGAMLHPAVKAHLPFAETPYDLAGYKMVGMANKAGFPDMKHAILEVVEGKNSAAFRAWFSGTNTASLMGNPPSGNHVELPFQGFIHFDAAGLMTEVRIMFDLAAFQTQLMKGLPAPTNRAAELANQFFYNVVGGKHDINLLKELLADDFSSSGFPFKDAGKAQFTDAIRSVVTAFPDIQLQVNTQYSEGNRVFTYGQWVGTHKGEFMGVPMTGNKIAVEFMDIWTEKDGKIVRNEVVMDIAALMQQIGGPTVNNKMITAKIFQSLSAGDLNSVVANFQPNVKCYGFDAQTLDANGYKMVLGELMAAFPDFRFTTFDMAAENDVVIVRHQFEGTHTGKPFQGFPITKNKVVVPATATLRFVDGKVSEVWLNADFLGLRAQLSSTTK